MAKKTFVGLNDKNPINIVWGGCPNNSYFVIRNHSYDDTITVMQIIRKIHTNTNVEEVKEITTPLKKGEEQSFFVEVSAEGLTLQSALDYDGQLETIPEYCRGATVIVSELPSKGGRAVFQVDILSARDYKVQTDITNKAEVYFGGKTDKSISPVGVKNREYADKIKYTDNALLAPSIYTGYAGAGRGYLIRKVEAKGSVASQDEAYSQVEQFEFQIGNLEHNKKDVSADVKVVEVPYIPKLSRNIVTEYSDAADAAKTEGNFESNRVMAGMAFNIEPSKFGSKEMRVTNIQNNSGINVVGTPKSTNDSTTFIYTPSGFDGDNMLLTDSGMYKIDANSQAQWYQDQFDPEKINGFAVTLKTVSTNYPYTVALTGPLLTGITFLSDNQLKINLRDRETLFSLGEGETHLNKVNRYCVVYGVTYVELYINGEKIEHETQNNTNIKGKQINSIGMDCRTFYSNEKASINMRMHILGDKSEVDMAVTAETVDKNSNEILLNDKTVRLNKVKATDSRIHVIPKVTTTGRANGILPYGGTKKEGLAHVNPLFFSMSLEGYTQGTPYTKSITLNKDDTTSVKCFGTSEGLQPIIELSTDNKTLDTKVIKIVKGRVSRVKLFNSPLDLQGNMGAETTYDISIDADLLVVLPSTNRVVNVEFKNPLTKEVQTKLTITIGTN